MTDQPEQIYEYQADTNRKAKVRTLMILSASGVLGAGVITASAFGIGGAVEEISLLDDQQTQQPQMQSRGEKESLGQPESNESDQPLAETNSVEPGNISAHGFAPRGDDHEEGHDEGFRPTRRHENHEEQGEDHDDEHHLDADQQEQLGFDAEDDEESEDD